MISRITFSVANASAQQGPAAVRYDPAPALPEPAFTEKLAPTVVCRAWHEKRNWQGAEGKDTRNKPPLVKFIVNGASGVQTKGRHAIAFTHV